MWDLMSKDPVLNARVLTESNDSRDIHVATAMGIMND